MPSDIPNRRLISLLSVGLNDMTRQLHARLADAGYPDIRPAHGALLGSIGHEGRRLTEVAEDAGITKQAMGEVVSDLERLGYLDRVPDPTDRRAKLLRLTARGRTAQATGLAILDDIERQWSERYGTRRFQAMRTLLEQHADREDAHRGRVA